MTIFMPPIKTIILGISVFVIMTMVMGPDRSEAKTQHKVKIEVVRFQAFPENPSPRLRQLWKQLAEGSELGDFLKEIFKRLALVDLNGDGIDEAFVNFGSYQCGMRIECEATLYTYDQGMWRYIGINTTGADGNYFPVEDTVYNGWRVLRSTDGKNLRTCWSTIPTHPFRSTIFWNPFKLPVYKGGIGYFQSTTNNKPCTHP